MATDREKLGAFLAEVINWRWDEFLKAEWSEEYTGYQAAVFALVRTCASGKLGAIRVAIDRVDGKIETPVKVEYPTVYFTYPYATEVEAGETDLALPGPEPEAEEKAEAEPELATMSLRETLNAMADQPRKLVTAILETRLETEEIFKAQGELKMKHIPLVKSVIAANLLRLAENNNFEAITEVFNQIDGKLVETIRVLGEDIELPQYATIAPAGAVKGAKGIYRVKQAAISNVWEQKLQDSNKYGR